MCGIAGFLTPSGLNVGVAESSLKAMLGLIAHRGPDDNGCWLDASAGIALGHRRLSIVDLSDSGHQPKSSQTGRFALIYNGEIYNHLELRRELERVSGFGGWEGHSDTETLLAGIEAWGLERTLQRCTGMFALALWDRQKRTLALARDRFGEKPLYYGWQGCDARRTFLFASELKALRRHPAFAADVDRRALTGLLRFAYVPAPLSIWTGIGKLEPGHILTLNADGSEIANAPFWRFVEVALEGTSRRFAGSRESAVDELDRLLGKVVEQQMLSDVPLGAFLSGGVDSSLIVAMMQKARSEPVKTFTIGFDDPAFDESAQARAVAAHLGTEHHELIVTAQDARDVIPKLPAIYCEPFADSSQIPTHLVSSLAAGHVKVALSGDAGDEVFAGYNRYATAARHWTWLSRIPHPLRRVAAALATSISPEGWDKIGGSAARKRFSMFGDKVHKAANSLRAGDLTELHLILASGNSDSLQWVKGGSDPVGAFVALSGQLEGLGAIERMMALDTLTYLPGDILAKVDRAAMAVSLETRAPYLDHELAAFAWSLPPEFKLSEGVTKWVLRQVLYRYVPQSLIDRPKAGFGVPVGSWLHGPLRDWAEDLLDPAQLNADGYFAADLVRQAWNLHLSGRRNMVDRLWPVLMFQQWLRANEGSTA
jgi:asparagine synthase (glutamine-hydrolysing)